MALSSSALTKFGDSQVSAGGVNNIYFYASADADATIAAAGYFNSARARLHKGDVIITAAVLGGTPTCKMYVVTAAPATGNVTVAVGSMP
jgi:hypothetical protein